jgi:glycosyltransferase involved in cell wall biosynthesis
LPLFADEDGLQDDTPVFFGGINVYLQQKCALFRHTPRWFDRILDSPGMLGLAARKASSTRPHGLGAMTLSMLRGANGRQAKEVRRMAAWLSSLQPDIVHFSNALLLGVAPEIVRVLPNTILVCSVQDEDTWIDGLEEGFPELCRQEMGKLLSLCAGIVSVSDSYAATFARKFALDRHAIRTIPPGLDPTPYQARPQQREPLAIGYLSRIAEQLGAGILAESYISMAKRRELSELKLFFGGGTTNDDKPLVRSIQARFAEAGLLDRVEFLPALKQQDRIDLINRSSVLCVPMPFGEAFGTFILESLFCGVPVVQPDIGGFHEILTATGGGLPYPPDAPGEPANSLGKLLLNPELRRQLGERGREKAVQTYTDANQADKLAGLYRELGGDS